MITIILVDSKGFQKAVTHYDIVPEYRIPVWNRDYSYEPISDMSKPVTSKYIIFIKSHEVAKDVWVYNEQ